MVVKINKNETVIYLDRWSDAQLMMQENPETFEAPNEDTVRILTKDQLVKISNGQERFWCRITQMIPNRNSPLEWQFRGQLVGDLYTDSNYQANDLVQFKGKHIYDIKINYRSHVSNLVNAFNQVSHV